MSIASKYIRIGSRKVSYAAVIWFIFALIATILQISRGPGNLNNYSIYKHVFWHTIHFQNLFAYYPAEYFDHNLYGPLFSLIIAPFSALPDLAGCILWCMANAIFLFYAIRQLPLGDEKRNMIVFIAVVELTTSLHNTQYNPMVAALIIMSYVWVIRGKDHWATLCIVIGMLTKIYGIVGLVFFLFSENKLRFIFSFALWFMILFALPMIISSPGFIFQSYQDWFTALTQKNDLNEVSKMQDISVMGMIRRVFTIELSNLAVLVPAAILYLLPLLRFSQYRNSFFRLCYLAFLLIGVVIFSSSAESSTYIIALLGVGIWFVIQPRRPLYTILLILVLIITSLSPTDIFPAYIRTHWIRPFSLKALPCLLVWLVLVFQLMSINFNLKKEVSHG